MKRSDKRFLGFMVAVVILFVVLVVLLANEVQSGVGGFVACMDDTNDFWGCLR